MTDFYASLEIPRDAGEAQIKQAYRKLAMRYHPDRNGGSTEAEEKFKIVTEAYDVLRDPQKRAVYDRYGEAGLRRGGGAGGFHHVDLSEALSIFMRDFGGFGGIDDLFGGRGARSGPRTGADIKMTVPLTLAEVATGVEKTITVKQLEPCDRCEASGVEPGSSTATCGTCRGSGEVRRAQRSFFGQFISVAPCPTCAGQGKVVENPCRKCRGEGRLRGEKTFPVNVPPGVATGQYMTLRGMGSVGPQGGPRGDILVVFEVADDDRFDRDGEELYITSLVSYAQLVLGGDVEVPTPTGQHVSVRIPAGTQSGQVFLLRGRGLPRVNARGVGDMHVTVRLWTPQSPSEEELRLIRDLSRIQGEPPQEQTRGFWSKVKEALGA
ncbi:MAG: molecular chaperone DnaJ [Gemmatimonadaceae bacterium]